MTNLEKIQSIAKNVDILDKRNLSEVDMTVIETFIDILLEQTVAELDKYGIKP